MRRAGEATAPPPHSTCSPAWWRRATTWACWSWAPWEWARPTWVAEAGALAAADHGSAVEPLDKVLGRAAGEAVRLGHNFLGCEHLLRGLASGPSNDPVAGALRITGVEPEPARVAVRAALAGSSQAQANPTLPGLGASVLAVLDEIRQRPGRLEQSARA